MSQRGGDGIVYFPGDIVISTAGDFDKSYVEVITLFGVVIRINDLTNGLGRIFELTVGRASPDLIVRFAAMAGGNGDGAGVGKRK